MAQVIKQITVDFAKLNVFQAVVAKQHDSNSRFLNVAFTNEGEPVSIESSASVVINALRADNQSKSFFGVVNDDGTVTVPLTTWMLELDDFLRCDISIISTDSSKLTSTSFGIEVEAASNANDEVSEDEDFDVLTLLLNDYENVKGAIGGCTWYIDTDRVVNKNGEECGSLADCMTDEYVGIWFYSIRSDSDKGVATYPSQYTIDGANGQLSLRDYVIWTGDRLVHYPVFEAKASTEVDGSTGMYLWQSGVDGRMSSTDKAYLTDLCKRFIASHQTAAKNSGNDCNESGLYSNVTSGRPVSVIDTNTPVGNMVSVRNHASQITSQLFLGQTTETDSSLHSDMWFRGNKDATQWLRALTSDNFIRFVNMNYTGYANWAVAPGIYKMKPHSADGDRAFTEEHTMFVIPGSPEPDADYLATAKNGDRVKMREHAITQLAINDATGAIKVRYCPIPKLDRSIGGYCIGWYDLHPGYEELGTDIDDLENDTQVLRTDVDSLKDKTALTGVIISSASDDVIELGLNTTEVVFLAEDSAINLMLPASIYTGWRCVLNLVRISSILGASVNLKAEGDSVVDESSISAGSCYLLCCGDATKANSVEGYRVIEIDPFTHLPVDSTTTE